MGASLSQKGRREIQGIEFSWPTPVIKTIGQDTSLTDSLRQKVRRVADFFRHAPGSAIPAGRRSDSGGYWQQDWRKATSVRVLRRAVAYSAYSSSNVRFAAVQDTSPICGRAGNAGSVVSGHTAPDPIVCIVTLIGWCASSETSSTTAAPLLSRLRAHRNCAGFVHSCHGTPKALSSPALHRKRCFPRDRYANGSESRRALRVHRTMQRSAPLGAVARCCGHTTALNVVNRDMTSAYR